MDMNRNEERFALVVAIHSILAMAYLCSVIFFIPSSSKAIFAFVLAAIILMATCVYGCLIAFKRGFNRQKKKFLKVLLVNLIPVLFCIPASFFLNSAEYKYVCAYTGIVYVVTVGVFIIVELYCRTGVAPPANENLPLDNAEPAWNL
uniref:Inner membrane transport protein YhaO n=1 Tax=Panagrellus redivivus TaxID=6233 RepID=A0A7E4VWM1_PANRE